MSEVATINGIQYIGASAPNESILHHAVAFPIVSFGVEPSICTVPIILLPSYLLLLLLT